MAAEKKSTIIKDALALFAITLVAGLVLGFVFEFTKPVIEANNLAAKTAAYASIYTDADTFTEDKDLNAKAIDPSALTGSNTEGITINELYQAVDASGSQIGYVMSVTSSKGFGGNITMSIGVTNDGNVTGVEFLEINETAGLGLKAKEPAFKDQYVNKGAESFEVTKDGASSDNQINAISGATITSKAVTNAVNAALYVAKTVGGN